jgi:hypothetical protein
MLKRYSIGICLAIVAAAGSAVAQKNPGLIIPVAPPAIQSQPPMANHPYTIPPTATRIVPHTETDQGAKDIAHSLPLDPAIRDLHDQLPPDVPAVERSLGLHPPRGVATDLRGQVPTPRQIVDALAPR